MAEKNLKKWSTSKQNYFEIPPNSYNSQMAKIINTSGNSWCYGCEWQVSTSPLLVGVQT